MSCEINSGPFCLIDVGCLFLLCTTELAIPRPVFCQQLLLSLVCLTNLLTARRARALSSTLQSHFTKCRGCRLGTTTSTALGIVLVGFLPPLTLQRPKTRILAVVQVSISGISEHILITKCRIGAAAAMMRTHTAQEAVVIDMGDLSDITNKDKKRQDTLFGPNIGTITSGPAWTEANEKEKQSVADQLTPEVVKGWIAKSKEVSLTLGVYRKCIS
jgi:hypothetical protein